MAKTQKSGSNSALRITIPYFDGVNAAVQPSLGKVTELSHAENVRAPLIGVIEKRQGQAKIGTDTTGCVFYTKKNYGLASMPLEDTSYQGAFRLSATQSFSNTYSISVYDYVTVIDREMVSSSTAIFLKVYDSVTVSEPDFFSRNFDGTCIIDGTSYNTSIYSLTRANQWEKLSAAKATNIIGEMSDHVMVDGSLVIVNGKDHNRMISSNGTTVTDATSAGSLYNSPRARRVAYYKSRIYLADFMSNGLRYGTTVLRSSYPVGLVSLINGDHTTATTIEITSTNYIYSDTGMNSYEIWRGNTLISTVTVTGINETSMTVSAPVSLLSADEVWVTGTHSGAKQYRWVNNPASTGRDVKQYDTFKLCGGEEDPITMFDTIGNILMMGNRNALMTWNDYTLENFDLGVGCVSQNGSVKLMGTLYFLHYSGVYSSTGKAPVLVSRKVERYIKGATKAGLESAAAGFKGNCVFFSIGDSTLYNPDGSLYKIMHDVCLEFNVLDQKWYVHTNVPANMFLNFINSSGTEQLMMGHTGIGCSIKEFLVGNTDDGDEIFFRADTNELQFMKEIEFSVQPLTVITNMHRGSLVTTMVSIDGGDFYEIEGTNRKGITPLKITQKDKQDTAPVNCRKIQLSFRESSKQLCRLVQAAIIYNPTTINYPEE